MKAVAILTVALAFVFAVDANAAERGTSRLLTVDDENIYEVEPTGRGTLDVATPNTLAEIDSSGRVLRRMSVHCTSLLRVGAVLVASCEGTVRAFDDELRPMWTSVASLCPDGRRRRGTRLFSDGVSRVVSVEDCSQSVWLRTVSLTNGSILGDTATGLFAWRNYLGFFIGFHGTTVVGGFVQPLPTQPTMVFVLAPDLSHVAYAKRECFGWDDGTHLHVVRDHRDVTLSDTLEPLARHLLPEPEQEDPDRATHDLGGSYLVREFVDHGTHYWLTGDCCGGAARPAGLYAAP